MAHEIEKICRRFDAIIFDLDGTLIDTAPDLCHALNHTLSTIELAPMRLAEVQDLIGNGARAMLDRGLRYHNVEVDLDPLFDIFVDYYGNNVARDSKVYPGLLPVIEELGVAGMAFGVCTNKPEALSHKLLAALAIDHHFPAVLGGDSLSVKKPDPEHILATLRKLDVDPSRALMIGDSANDVNAAKAARIPVIAVSFGYTEIPARDLGADLVIDHFDELSAALAKLS